MKSTFLRGAVFKHGLKTWGLMLLLLTPLVLLGNYISNWLFYILFFGIFFIVIVPFHFGVGPIGRRFGRELNDAALLANREYRTSFGQNIKTDDIKEDENRN